MKAFLKRYRADIGVIFILTALGILFPILWLQDGYTIVGHDAGLPFEPIKHVTDRFFVWTERVGFGSDQSHVLGAVPIHAFEALIQLVVRDVRIQQIVIFAIWMTLPGIAMYIMMRSLFKREHLFLAVFASLFYMFNHFLLQAWWIVERTKFSLYVALPLVLTLLIRYFQKQSSLLITSCLLTILLFFFNGGGFIPLFGAIFIAGIVCCGFYLYLDFSFETVLRLVKLLSVTFLLSLPVNLYWLSPYFVLFQESYAAGVSSIGGIKSVLQWADYISSEASLFNLLRLQGIIDWTGNPLHPYAAVFTENPFFLIVSYLLAPLAFSSILIAKDRHDKRIILFFALAALIAMLFIGGTHQPFGFLFRFLMEYVPGFVVFRTPYYKFAPVLWIAYAVLISYTLTYAITYLRKNSLPTRAKKLAIMTVSVVVLGVYNYPYFTAEFFNYMKDLRTTRIQVPGYIYDINDYIEQQRKHARMLLLPEASNSLAADAYTWGYWSLAPVTSLLSNSYTVTNRNNDTESEIKLVNDMYQSMKDNSEAWKKIMFKFGVDTVVLRRDYAVSEDSDEPADFSQYDLILAKSNLFTPIKTIGMWQFYALDTKAILPTISVLPDVLLAEGFLAKKPLLPHADYIGLYDLEDVTNQTVVIFDEFSPRANEVILPNKLYIVPECSLCTKLNEVETIYAEDRILPNSVFFPIVTFWEKRALEAERDVIKREVLLAALLEKRVFALSAYRIGDRNVVGDYVKIESLILALLRDIDTSLKIPSNDKNQDTIRGTHILRYVYAAKLELIQRLDETIFEPERKILSDSLTKADELIRIANTLAFSSVNEPDKQFQFTVTDAGKYDVIVDKESLAQGVEQTDLLKLQLVLDGKQIPILPTGVGGDWIHLASVDVPDGAHQLSLRDLESQNLYAVDESRKSQFPFATFAPDGFSFPAPVLDQKCVSIPITNTEPGAHYQIGFTYNISQPDRRLIFYAKDMYAKDMPADLALIINKGISIRASTGSNDFETRRVVGTNDLHLHFCSDFYVGEFSPRVGSYQVSNIEVRKISQPNLLLRKVIAQPSKASPLVYFKRMNPAQYHISIANPSGNAMLLNFAERFNNQWKLYPVTGLWGFDTYFQVNPEISTYQVPSTDVYFDKNILTTYRGKPVDERYHVMTNGFSNGWWITPGETQDYILLYDKQKRYYVGAGISVIAIIVFVVAFSWYFLFYRSKRADD